MRKRCFGVLLMFTLLAAVLTADIHAAYRSEAAEVVSKALSQIDYEEEEGGYSRFGDWYGLEDGAWCDMFVSWCARRAHISEDVLPNDCSCTSHVGQFSELECYHMSASRGGDYVPRQGDLIFFYNNERYPDGEVLRHVGYVLCVENGCVFTVEGNTITNRLDYPYNEEVLPQRNYSIEPTDYVAVKCYSLDEPTIHGYASPYYESREELAHDGFVDLGQYAYLGGMIDLLVEQGVMEGTSAYTFSPRYGMTRGEFLAIMMRMFDLSGWDEDTGEYVDVPEDSPYYDAVMTARCAGFIDINEDNMFHPDIYVDGESAQAIISRTLAYVGLGNRTFEFSEGDLSYLLTPYTIRADIARALFELLPEAEWTRENRPAEEEPAEEEPSEEEQTEEERRAEERAHRAALRELREQRD
ncbi:MAG: CHAP domain-containing protein [Ruminococcaceae bacterium]|nr:CHAP domain-containing protein [Oscillospiraceae bacterium]